MRQPKQKRSVESLENVIATAEEVLRAGSADDLTIGRVVELSGVSVGSIYARFSDKEGIFRELVSRFMRHTTGEFEQREGERWRSLCLSDAIDEIVWANAEIYHAHRGVLRALIMRTKLSRDPDLQIAIAEYNRVVCSELRSLLLIHADQIEHPNPQEAISVLIEVLTTMLRDTVILSNGQNMNVRAVERVQDLLKRYLRPSEYALSNSGAGGEAYR